MSTQPPPGGDTVYWPVEKLRLDPENPRLAETLRDASQQELLETFYWSYDLEPLLLSMAQHGYFSEEPLIGIRSNASALDSERDPEDDSASDDDSTSAENRSSDDKSASVGEFCTIVEGNRRLATLQILLFDWAREAVKAEDLPEITPEARQKLNPVPVKEYLSRADVVPYLGVRHIRGVKDWDPLAKARYVRWLKADGYTIREIVRIVGGRRDVVQRWLLTLYALEQANTESDSKWDESPDAFKFSWLYTSLGYTRVRDFLGFEGDVLTDPQPNPVDRENMLLLLEHMRDLYGPPPGIATQAKVKDSREIRQLAAVYASPDAVDALRAGATLAEAFSRSVGEEEQLLDYLRRINRDLEQSISIAHRHKGHTEISRLADRAAGAAAALVQNLK